MKSTLLTMIVVGLALSSVSLAAESAQPQNADEEEVRRVIEYSIGWAVEKDFDKMFAVWAHDKELYHHWLTSTSTTRGFDEFAAHAEVWRDPKFKGTTFKFRDLDITFSQSGDVAWYSCHLDDENEWNGQPASWLNVRWTGVLEKREGDWVIVQMHFSYGVEAGTGED